MMADMKALGGLAEASPEAMVDLFQQARQLRDTLDHFISGIREPPGLRCVLRFATSHLENGHSSEGLRGMAMEERALCGHRCAQLAPVDPSVWSRLPEDLLERIFARLPVADICRLQCLSKRWQQKITGRSHFKVACAERNAPIIALVHDLLRASNKFTVTLYEVTLYDVNTNRWHFMKLDDRDSIARFQTPSATDGGLVCFSSACEARYGETEGPRQPMQIVVCNLLTGDRRRLERPGVKTCQVEMLQITTNRTTGHYKVLLGAHTGGNVLRCSVEIFDSQTDKWTTLERLGNDAPPGDLIFGIRYNWELEDVWESIGPGAMGPCVVDCTKGELDELDDDSKPYTAMFVHQYAIVHDRVFVQYDKAWEEELDEGSADEADEGNVGYGQASTMEDRFCFTEYKLQTTDPQFDKLRTVKCCHPKFPRGDDYDETSWTVCACEGFVLLVGHETQTLGSTREAMAFLYDLTTDEWRMLPFVPPPLRFQHNEYDHLLCSMRWDACSTP